MRIFLFLIVICLVFFSCQSESKQERVVEWIDETSNENILYEFDTSRIAPTIFKTYSREISDEKSNKYMWSWTFEFVPLKGKNREFLAPLDIKTFPGSYNDNFKLPDHPLHHIDYDLQVVLNSDESFHYLISLCEIFEVKNPKRSSKEIAKISPRKLQKLLFDSTVLDTTLIEYNKKRWFSDIPSDCIWCKQLKVVPLDTTLIISEIAQDSLPTFFNQFDNITITESGNYLDTLRFRKEDLMKYQRDYQ